MLPLIRRLVSIVRVIKVNGIISFTFVGAVRFAWSDTLFRVSRDARIEGVVKVPRIVRDARVIWFGRADRLNRFDGVASVAGVVIVARVLSFARVVDIGAQPHVVTSLESSG